MPLITEVPIKPEVQKSKANKNFTKQADSWIPESPQTTLECCPAFSRGRKGRVLAEETVRTLKQADPAWVLRDLDFRFLSEACFQLSGKWG